MEECKVYKSCRFGADLGEGYSCCNYMIMTGRSRCSDPRGEIKDGKCGYYDAGKGSGKKNNKPGKK